MPKDCQTGAVGKFSFDATLANISEKELSNLHVEVDELANKNLLLTDNGLIGEGERFEVSKIDEYADGILSHEEFVDVTFTVCLQEKSPFRFFVNVLGVAEDIDLEKGLVAFYPFNGNANDESGNGNDGIVQGATLAEDRFGNPNRAYSFDGVDDYIEMNRISVLDFGTNDFAISGWFYARTLTGNYTGDRSLVSRWARGNWAWDLRIGWPSGGGSTNQMYFGFGNSPSDLIRISDNIVTTGIWHHVVATRRNGILYGYLDGVEFDAGDQSSKIASSNSNMRLSNFEGYFNIGPNETAGFLNGLMDDIRIYNRALSEAEVKALYNLGN